MRARRAANVLAWVLASAAPPLAQAAPEPTPTPARRFGPLLPNEGLLQGRTWLGIGGPLLERAKETLAGAGVASSYPRRALSIDRNTPALPVVVAESSPAAASRARPGAAKSEG
jgi:hypothetical protein